MKKWQSGKFWLKTLSICLIGMFVLGVGSQAILYRYFSSDNLHQIAETSFADAGRRVRFDAQVSRGFFPRPTVSLRNVTLSEPNSDKIAVHIKEMRTGVAWSNLWSAQPTIEKWVWIQPHIHLSQHSNSQWNIDDLLKKRDVQVNRLIIENGRFQMVTPTQNHLITAFKAKIKGLTDPKSQFEISGETLQKHWQQVTWQAQGIIEKNVDGWRIPSIKLQGTAQPLQHPLSFKLNTSLEYQSGNLKTGPLKLQASSPDNELNINAESGSTELSLHKIRLNDTNAIATARKDNQDWTGSLNVHQINWRPTVLTTDQIQLKASRQNTYTLDTATLNTTLVWQKKLGFALNNLALSTRQEQRRTTSHARFVSQLEGWLKSTDGYNWQTNLSGQIERQPATIKAEYQHGPQPTLNAVVHLHKLSLSPYWLNLSNQTSHAYPAFLAQGRLAKIEADVKIDSLITPGVQLDDFSVRVDANPQHIQLSSLHAALYGGHTEGGLNISNANPPILHLQQYFQNVQISPLLNDLLGVHSLHGRGNAVIDLTSKGGKKAQWLSALNGRTSININQGSLEGIDFAKTLQNLRNNQTNHLVGDNEQTPFERFSLDTLIVNGISQQSRSELISGNVTVTSHGKTDFNLKTLQENVTVSVRNNGRINSVPLQINGTFDKPSIALDYQRLTKGLSTPEEKQQVLTNALKEQWQWLKPERSASETAAEAQASGSLP